jgi:hypothetical protein
MPKGCFRLLDEFDYALHRSSPNGGKGQLLATGVTPVS